MTTRAGNQSICRKSGREIGTGPSGYRAYGNRGNPRKTCGFPPFPQARETLSAGKLKEAELTAPAQLFPRKKEQDCYEPKNRVETQIHATWGGSMILKTPG